MSASGLSLSELGVFLGAPSVLLSAHGPSAEFTRYSAECSSEIQSLLLSAHGLNLSAPGVLLSALGPLLCAPCLLIS